MENGANLSDKHCKRVRGSSSEINKKAKKGKVDNQNDKKDEGQGGFDNLSDFLANIQQLNDGNLSFELDVSYSSFKLKLNYNFE